MRKILALLALLLAVPAQAQSVQQSGSSVTAGHVAIWAGNGLIKDGGTAANGFITSLGVVNNGGPGICTQSAATTSAGYNQLCLSASTAAAAQITLQNYGTATAQNLNFVINGATITLPTGGGSTLATITTPLTTNDVLCASNTTGLVKDCTFGVTVGTANQIAYWSGPTALVASSTIPAAVQLNITQLGTVTAGTWNATTVDVAHGGTSSTNLTAHGVLIGEGTGAITSLTSSNVGFCLLSQGTGVDPIFGGCGSGAGSAGGSNTQVQYNNATSLAGSVNFTWVSPALSLGAAASATGQLKMVGTTSGVVTIQSQDAAGTYNFNLPTGAGSSGQPLLSGGGGVTAMSFGTLGVGGGGTNCSAASGTCLDNITGFNTTGYITRTGAGTYAFSTNIPVSGGGTGLGTGTSGGIPYFSASSTMASSGALTQHGIVIGGGTGATPTTLGVGGAGTVLTGVASSDPAFSAIPVLGINASTTGQLGLANGGALGATVTLQNITATSAYNFNMPATAGTAGQVLLSGGGTTNPMTWTGGTLAITSAKALSFTNSLTFSGTDSTTMTFPASSGTIAALNIAGQAVTGGVHVTSNNLGTISSGTTALDNGTRPTAYATNGGAFTLAVDTTHDGSMALEITNNASAGAVTISGTSGACAGATPDTTNGHKFLYVFTTVNAHAYCSIVAGQ